MEDYKNKTSDDDKVSWNMADALMREIGEHLGQANKLLVNAYPDNIVRAFRELLAVKRRIIQSLKPEERKTFLRKEKAIRLIIGAYRYYTRLNKDLETRTPKNAKLSHKYIGMLVNHLDQYNETLMDLLEDRGYLIAKQKDTKSVM